MSAVDAIDVHSLFDFCAKTALIKTVRKNGHAAASNRRRIAPLRQSVYSRDNAYVMVLYSSLSVGQWHLLSSGMFPSKVCGPSYQQDP